MEHRDVPAASPLRADCCLNFDPQKIVLRAIEEIFVFFLEVYMHRRLSRKPDTGCLYSLAFTLLTLLCNLLQSRPNIPRRHQRHRHRQTGAAIANATVIAVQTDTDVTHTTTSSSGGEFLFQDLPLGSYSVTVIFPASKPSRPTRSSSRQASSTPSPSFSSSPASATTIEVEAAGDRPRHHHPPRRPRSSTQRLSPTFLSTVATSPR